MDEKLSFSQRFSRNFTCTSENGLRYRLRYLHIDWDGPIDEMYDKVVADRYIPESDTWMALPSKLSLRSQFLLFTAADPQWPPDPHTVVAMGHDGTSLWFEYEEDLDEMRWGRAHSRWRASFSDKRQRWTIQHLNYLKEHLIKF